MEPRAQLESDRPGPRGSKVIVAFLAVTIAAVAAYLIVAMPGMDHGSGAMAPMVGMNSNSSSIEQVDASTFERFVADPGSVLINVHIPYEGEISGTDSVIAYNALIGAAALPGDKSARVLLYCKTGRMSAEAASALADAGYTQIVELAGGTDAWQASGRPLIVVAR